MLNLGVEKGARKDHYRSRSSITWPKTGTLIGFAQRFGLFFGFQKSLYMEICAFFFFLFYCSIFDNIYM